MASCGSLTAGVIVELMRDKTSQLDSGLLRR